MARIQKKAFVPSIRDIHAIRGQFFERFINQAWPGREAEQYSGPALTVSSDDKEKIRPPTRENIRAAAQRRPTEFCIDMGPPGPVLPRMNWSKQLLSSVNSVVILFLGGGELDDLQRRLSDFIPLG